MKGRSRISFQLPAASVLIGQCLRLYSDRSAEGRHARVWRHVRWAHMALLVAVSIALPVAMVFQDALVDRGVLPSRVTAPTPWYFWAGLGVSLLLITLMSMRFALRHYPGKATICWSPWGGPPCMLATLQKPPEPFGAAKGPYP